MSAGVCFIDTETLGLDADVHPVWEVGLIEPDGTERQWLVKVSQRDLSLAHPKALEIGRFDERYDSSAAHDPEWVAMQLLEITRGCHLAGAVVSFDEERLRRLIWKFGWVPTWHYHLIDVEALAAGWLSGAFQACQELSSFADPKADGPTQEQAMCAQPPWNSNDLSLAVGVNPEDFDRHTALGDARWAKAIYEAVLGA